MANKKKTHKGMAKRFKVTGSGKKLRRSASFRGHLKQRRSPKKLRQLRKPRIDSVTNTNAKKIAEAIS